MEGLIQLTFAIPEAAHPGVEAKQMCLHIEEMVKEEEQKMKSEMGNPRVTMELTIKRQIAGASNGIRAVFAAEANSAARARERGRKGGEVLVTIVLFLKIDLLDNGFGGVQVLARATVMRRREFNLESPHLDSG
ncbi:unnamed protein product [Tuber aestivum]|uniref:Uncharacterized protein n=1 Tax=Tuber aestivum TaxID=59557 RepID=A0A292Q6E9_9PEZI|nr:unnamed protein product [Tuber aestivum]